MSEIPPDEDFGEPEEPPLDPRVTPALFQEWRARRRGTANPERMNNPVWEWLVKSKLSAYQAAERLGGPSAVRAEPGWCFARFGQSSTPLPDGRTVLIAGEHEDFYDPDFYIYNDVVVLHPDGWIDIFGYPREVFPPTDFHSATLAGNWIVIVGNLGYPEARRPEVTPVFVLDLDSLSISAVQTTGTPPGWLHKHQASLGHDGASLIITRGLLKRGSPEETGAENIDEWRLGLTDWHWERLTHRRWSRWEVRRVDREWHHLSQISQAVWERDFPRFMTFSGGYLLSAKRSLTDELGAAPDLQLFELLYKPEVPHESLPDSEEDSRVHRIAVSGVTVRYVDNGRSIKVTVEGELPSATTEALTVDLLRKFAALENSACELRSL